MADTWITLTRRMASWRMAVLLAGAWGLAGCSALDVTDPTRIESEELDSPIGAALLRDGAIQLYGRVFPDEVMMTSAFTDEVEIYPFSYETTGSVDAYFDSRNREQLENNQYSTFNNYSRLQQTRRYATTAMPRIRAYLPEGVRESSLAEMYALRGYATLQLAEDYCPGFPLHQLVDLQPVYGPPVTTDQAFQAALADFDSALAVGTDTVRVVDFARIGKARALLGLGDIAGAGAAVTAVDEQFSYVLNFGFTSSVYQPNPLFFQPYQVNRTVGNHDGGNGLDFVAAEDPRVVADSFGVANDNVHVAYRIGKYASQDAPVVVASGIEARLIAAEAALAAGQAVWIDILNALREEYAPSLSELSAPATPEAKQDLLFRERAFWLFATGHRLGDLRRMVTRYNRAVSEVFPTGPYHVGGEYGSSISLPFPWRSEKNFSPNVTGCLD